MVRRADSELIQGFLSGDWASLSVVTRWIRGVIRCQSWNHIIEEDDVVQETLTALVVSLREHRYRGEGLRAYAESICKNKCLNVLRESRRTRQLDDGAENDVLDLAPNPEEHLEAAQRIDVLRRAMAELKPQCRQLIKWMYLEDRRGDEIARVLGISHGAVRQQLFKCRKRLTELCIRFRDRR